MLMGNLVEQATDADVTYVLMIFFMIGSGGNIKESTIL